MLDYEALPVMCALAMRVKPGAAYGPGRPAREYPHRGRGRRQGEDRRGLRQGDACRALRDLDPPCYRHPDGAARGARLHRREGRYSIWAGTGGGMVRERGILAGALGVPHLECRAKCGDMGGIFGTRNTFFAEYGLLPGPCRSSAGR